MIQTLFVCENDDGEALVGVGCSVLISDHLCTEKHLGVMRVLCLSLPPIGLLDDPELPVCESTFCYPGSIPLSWQHLRGVSQVGPEEAPGTPSSNTAPHRATCARQDIRKGRDRASRGPAK